MYEQGGSVTKETWQWLLEHALMPGGLATILVLVFLAMFSGFIPTPLTAQVQEVHSEHKEIKYLLTQICINGGKDSAAIARCFVYSPGPGVVQELSK